MKLQSKFDDFYDWCANTYRDEETFYKREQNIITFNKDNKEKKDFIDFVNRNTTRHSYFDSDDQKFVCLEFNRDEPKLNINESLYYKINKITKSFCIIANQAHPVYSIFIGSSYSNLDKEQNSIIKNKFPNYVDNVGVFNINKPKNTEGNDEKYKHVGNPLTGFHFSTFEGFYNFIKNNTDILSHKRLEEKIKKMQKTTTINQHNIENIRKLSKEPTLYISLSKGWMFSTRIPEILENPRLVDLDLHNTLDSQKVYQDIMMHINAFNEPKPLISIEDKHILEGKGFNNKSFRKESNKPKRRNKSINKP